MVVDSRVEHGPNVNIVGMKSNVPGLVIGIGAESWKRIVNVQPFLTATFNQKSATSASMTEAARPEAGRQ